MFIIFGLGSLVFETLNLVLSALCFELGALYLVLCTWCFVRGALYFELGALLELGPVSCT
jgi:hypothetical protein